LKPWNTSRYKRKRLGKGVVNLASSENGVATLRSREARWPAITEAVIQTVLGEEYLFQVNSAVDRFCENTANGLLQQMISTGSPAFF